MFVSCIRQHKQNNIALFVFLFFPYTLLYVLRNKKKIFCSLKIRKKSILKKEQGKYCSFGEKNILNEKFVKK